MKFEEDFWGGGAGWKKTGITGPEGGEKRERGRERKPRKESPPD
jgi:hypothetical protein